MSQPNKQPTPFTPLQGLSLVVDIGLTQKQYESLIAISPLTPFFPTYNTLQQLKTKCLPNWKSTYHFNESLAEVNIQPLMEHTARRLLMHLDKSIKTLNERQRKALQIKYKWGCDGAHQSLYEDEQSNIIQSSFMPIQLVCKSNQKIIWQNPVSWSSRYCRPIRIHFEKATPDIMLEEIDYIKNGISTLKASKISLNNKTFTVQHTMMYTEIDMQVCNADAHDSGTLKCYICDLTTKDFNNLAMVKQNVLSRDELKFGLSITHIRTRLFESLLYLSYKLPLNKWQPNNASDKTIIEKRKQEIKDKFSNEMDLLVDKPKSGCGTYNDGWASRKFFLKPEKTAQITGINVDLIKRFKIIIETISCKYKIDLDKFAAYAQQTAELYVELYPWYPMTATMHKVLMHGPTIIEHCIVAIGQVSRVTEKMQNKRVPLFNQQYLDGEFSQVDCNKEILNDLLLRSDPVITGLSHCLEGKKKLRFLQNETKELLLPVETEMPQDSDDSDEEEVEDSELSSDEN